MNLLPKNWSRRKFLTGTLSAAACGFADMKWLEPRWLGSGEHVVKLGAGQSETFPVPVLDHGEAVRLTVDGATRSQRFRVVNDPRSGATPAELAATWAFNSQVVAKLNLLGDHAKRIETMQKQIADREAQAKGQPYAARVTAASGPLKARLEAIRAELADVHSQADQITLHYPVKLYNQLLNVNRMGQSFDRGPTEQGVSVFRDLGSKVDAQLDRLRALEAGDLAAFNAMMRELNVPAVTAEQPKPIA